MHLLTLPSFSEEQHKANGFHESSLIDKALYLCFREIRGFYLAIRVGCGQNAYGKSLQNILFSLLEDAQMLGNKTDHRKMIYLILPFMSLGHELCLNTIKHLLRLTWVENYTADEISILQWCCWHGWHCFPVMVQCRSTKMTPRATQIHFVSSRKHWLFSVQWHVKVCQAENCVTPSGYVCHPNNAQLVCDYQKIKKN